MNDQTTRVRVGMSATINLGDYNIMKVEVSVDDFVRTDLDEGKVGSAVDRVTALVESKLATKVEEYKS